MGPTGEIFEPMGTMTHALAVEIFHEQAEALKAGGADVLWIETMSAFEEYAAAAEAATMAGLPWCLRARASKAGAASCTVGLRNWKAEMLEAKTPK